MHSMEENCFFRNMKRLRKIKGFEMWCAGATESFRAL